MNLEPAIEHPASSIQYPVSPTAAPAPARLTSLDVFRGATIASMILVNNPGNWNALYSPLEHAPWHGWTFTDLIFPFFLWIVGVAIPLSVSRRIEQGQSRQELLLHAVRRSAILFGLGFFLSMFSWLVDGSLFQKGFVPWLQDIAMHVRIPGVLQRIAICYLVTTFIFLRGARRSAGFQPAVSPTSSRQTGATNPAPENCSPSQAGKLRHDPIVRLVSLWIVTLLAAYWLLMKLVPVPGYGAGILEKNGNLCQYLDNLILNGPHIGTHVWASAKTWDPEGILSTLPAIATCLFGVLTGCLLRSNLLSETKKAGWILGFGALLLLCGLVMVKLGMPINKNLWTSSYSVFMAGMAMICFAVCFFVIDIKGWKKWAKPFVIYGMNAITVFVLAGILGRLSLAIKVPDSWHTTVALKTYLYDRICAPFADPQTAPFFGFLASPKNASLMWALMYVMVLYLAAYAMYRKKWFVRF